MGHNINGGSRLFRRKLCPGSANAERGLPDTDNKYSLLGTAEHLVAAMANEGPESAFYWIDQDIEIETADGGHTQVRMERESIEAIKVYNDYINRRRREIDEVKPAEFEKRVNPGLWWDGRTDVGGTADAILYGAKITEIIDYKGGAGVPVEVEANEQALSYATGAAAEMDWSQADPEHIIRLTIVQPKCPHPDGPVRSWDIYPGDLYQMAKEWVDILAKTDDPDAPRIPGEKQCRFCKAKGTCPELAKESLSVFESATPAATESPAAVPETQDQWDSLESVLLRPVDQLSPAQIAQILDKAPLFRSWLDGVGKQGLKMHQEGQHIPHHKLVRAKTHRKYAASDDEIIAKMTQMNNAETKKKIRKAECIKTKAISITEAEKRIKTQVTERTWNSFAKKYIIKPEGAPTLVPETDPRESISTADIFQKQEPEAPPPAPWD